jgi:hypothetical protein
MVLKRTIIYIKTLPTNMVLKRTIIYIKTLPTPSKYVFPSHPKQNKSLAWGCEAGVYMAKVFINFVKLLRLADGS